MTLTCLSLPENGSGVIRHFVVDPELEVISLCFSLRLSLCCHTFVSPLCPVVLIDVADDWGHLEVKGSRTGLGDRERRRVSGNVGGVVPCAALAPLVTDAQSIAATVTDKKSKEKSS